MMMMMIQGGWVGGVGCIEKVSLPGNDWVLLFYCYTLFFSSLLGHEAFFF